MVVEVLRREGSNPGRAGTKEVVLEVVVLKGNGDGMFELPRSVSA